jgi:hypothetical protein
MIGDTEYTRIFEKIAAGFTGSFKPDGVHKPLPECDATLTLAEWLKFSFPNDPDMAESELCSALKIDRASLRWLLENPDSNCVVVAACLYDNGTGMVITSYTITIPDEPSGGSSTFHVDLVGSRHPGGDALDQPPSRLAGLQRPDTGDGLSGTV